MNRVLELVQGRNLILDGALSQGQKNFVPYLNFNGTTNGSHVRAREYRGLNGFTFGGWFQTGAAAGTLGSVWYAAANQTWRLYFTGTKPTFGVSGTGANEILAQHPVTVALNTWYFIAGRYNPSTEVALWVNATKTVNTTAVPASLYLTGTIDFCIGSTHTGINLLTGKAAMLFFCNAIVPDIYLTSLYNLGKSVFN